jgi:hypothetical protein
MTLRAKSLIGIAVACLGYVVLVPDTSQTIEPTRGGAAPSTPRRSDDSPGPRAGHASISRGKTPPVSGLLPHSGRVVEGVTASALFAPNSWVIAPPPPPPAAPAPVPAPPPPTAPPLPFAFMGSYRTDGKATYFLTAGERVYDVRVGDTLDGKYSVDGVSAGQMLLTYLPLKIQQTLMVGNE